MNLRLLDCPAPATVTVICPTPPDMISPAASVISNVVALITVVGRGCPFQKACAPVLKLVPVTCTTSGLADAPCARMAPGDSVARVGGGSCPGCTTEKASGFENPPPGA